MPAVDHTQVGAYIVIVALSALFFGLLAPAVIPRDLRIITEALYAALTAGTMTFVIVAT